MPVKKNRSNTKPKSESKKKSVRGKPLNPLSFQSDFEQKKRRIVWLSVTTIMVFIFSLWVVNVRAQFTDANFRVGTEEMLLQKAKQNFQNFVKIPDTTPVQKFDEIKQEENTEKIKSLLSENLMRLTSTTPTIASSTLSVSTSSLFVSSTNDILLQPNE